MMGIGIVYKYSCSSSYKGVVFSFFDIIYMKTCNGSIWNGFVMSNIV